MRFFFIFHRTHRLLYTLSRTRLYIYFLFSYASFLIHIVSLFLTRCRFITTYCLNLLGTVLFENACNDEKIIINNNNKHGACGAQCHRTHDKNAKKERFTRTNLSLRYKEKQILAQTCNRVDSAQFTHRQATFVGAITLFRVRKSRDW